jgi:hypothetical protein
MRNRGRRIVSLGLWRVVMVSGLFCALVNQSGHCSTLGPNHSAIVQVTASEPGGHDPESHHAAQGSEKRYRWLLKERKEEESVRETESTTLLQKLDKEIKEARRLYLAGQTENSILKYRSVLDNLESILEDIPPGHPLLRQVEDRLPVFDELATKMLGPIQLEPQEELSGRIFHLMEKRRICRRDLIMKKAGLLKFFDVSSSLLAEEAEILRKILQVKAEAPSSESRQTTQALATKLADVRKALKKSSPRYALLRKGAAIPLAEVQRDLIGKDEMILDFNFLADRMVVGVITAEKALYHQVPANRSEIDKGVFHLQEKLREFTMTGRSSFMGHAWKEPSRRIYRALMGKLPLLPADKRTVFIIPDRSLWYLPFSVMLDAEDRPFGRGHTVSLISSVDLLKFIRSSPAITHGAQGGDLLLFEAIPWIPEDQAQASPRESPRKKPGKRISEEEQIERLILANPVYPKPSEIVVSLQKFFKKFDVWVGQTATVEKLLDYKGREEQVTVMAVPLAMTDEVKTDSQPTFFFAPDATGNRRFDCRKLFEMSLGTRILVLPISWLDIPDAESPAAEGPLLLNIATSYAGVRMSLINYADPNWGADEPFLLTVLKDVAGKTSPSEAVSAYPCEMPAGLDSSFSGKPPSWTGWILMGDPS